MLFFQRKIDFINLVASDLKLKPFQLILFESIAMNINTNILTMTTW